MSTSNFTTNPTHDNVGWQCDPEANPPSSNEGKSPNVEMNVEHTDAIFEHLSRTFSVRELLQLQCVSKTWKTLVSGNVAITTKAQLEDESKDCYFPVCFKPETNRYISIDSTNTPASEEQTCILQWCNRGHRWTWSGIHHSSTLFELHSLPPLPLSLHGTTINCVLTSSKGLLLVTNKLRISTTPQNWRPLVVWNPLTKLWRELPVVDCRDVGLTLWKYSGTRYHMMVDEHAKSYKVFLTFRTSLCVYISTSNCWKCHVFPQRVPWGFCPIFRRLYQFMVSPSAILDGKLFYADLEVNGNVVPTRGQPIISDLDVRTWGVVRVFEIDEEAGMWKPAIQYALRNYFPNNPNHNYGFEPGSYGIKLIDCMGGLYAIIPARYHGLLTSEDGMIQNYRHDNYLSQLQFYILELQGGVGLGLGQLLIENPCTSGNLVMNAEEVEFRHKHLSDHLGWVVHAGSDKMFPDLGGWFQCTSRGNVIWLSCWDYLLQYDVVSRQSKTEIIRGTSFDGQPDFSYKPSFYMKP